MASLNANLPYLRCYIRDRYLGTGEGVTECYIFGVKALINRALMFHAQTHDGAVIWGQPISAFVHKPDYDPLSDDEEKRLSLLETWDCQSSDISVTSFAFLQWRRVDVHCRDGKWRRGTYLWTIDDYYADANNLSVGYANDVDSKCFQFLEMEDGNYAVQPNNLLRWHNPDFIVPYPKDAVPKLKVWSRQLSSEDIDRSYGNSAYFFYGQEG